MNPSRHVQLASCHAHYDLRRLANDAVVVAEGHIVASSGPFELQPRADLRASLPDRFSLVFTLRFFLLNEVFKPSNVLPPWPNTIVPVATLGGVGENLSASVEGEAQLATGEVVVLFLAPAMPAFDWLAELQALNLQSQFRSLQPWLSPFAVLGGAQGKFVFDERGQLHRGDLEEAISPDSLRGLFR